MIKYLIVLILVIHVLAEKSTEIDTYYNKQHIISKWLPFNLNCSDCFYDKCYGQKCNNDDYTIMYKNDNKYQECYKYCDKTNISTVMNMIPFKDGFPVLIVTYGLSKTRVLCWYKPINNKIIYGITTTIWYNYYYDPYKYNDDFVKVINCTIKANYTANIWTEKIVYIKQKNIAESINGSEIILIILMIILACSFMMIMILFVLILITKCLRLCNNNHKNKNKIEFIGYGEL